MIKVMFSGSFDPFHKGHEYVFNAICNKFGKNNVYLGIGKNDKKNSDICRILYSLVPVTENVIVYDGLTADVVRREGFDYLVRGIRDTTDMKEESALAYWNKELCGVDTLFIMTSPELKFVSSSALKSLEAYEVGSDIIFKYIDPDVYYRYKTGKESFSVVFGQCCSGKSTYLKNNSKDSIIIEMDKEFWNYIDLRDENKKSMITILKTLFYNKEYSAFNACMESVMYKFKWDDLLEAVDFNKKINDKFTIVDFPAIGCYWDFIPDDIKAKMHLTKIWTENKNRSEFALKRNTNPNLIECSDYFYKDPPYFNTSIQIFKHPTMEIN